MAMLNSLKAKRHTILGVILAFCFSVSACSPTELVCLTGLCPTLAKKHIRQAPWDPQTLDRQNCPDISGKYGTRGSLMSQFPDERDQLGFIQVKVEQPEDRRDFYRADHFLVQQGEKELVVSLMDGNGKLYRRQTILLDSPMIGCADGALIIRTVSGMASLDIPTMVFLQERRFRKRPGGSLLVTVHYRTWRYDNLFGLMGKPSESRDTKIYLSVP
jgi:hypothetical protein